MLGRFRDFVREYFTRTVCLDDDPLPRVQDTTRAKAKVKRRRTRSVAPSERFVWAMVVLVVALVGLVAIEIVYVLVTGQISTEILVVVSGLVGALASRFLEAKR